MAEAVILHEDPRSGNCYKIKLTAALLGLPLETRAYDIMKGETRTPEFLATVNANGRIPVLQIGEGDSARFLPESNAACWYLAHGSALIPQERFAQSDMLRWMFFEQYNHEPNVATLRFWLRFVGDANLSAEQRAQIMPKRVAGCGALDLMNRHLATRAFFAVRRRASPISRCSPTPTSPKRAASVSAITRMSLHGLRGCRRYRVSLR